MLFVGSHIGDERPILLKDIERVQEIVECGNNAAMEGRYESTWESDSELTRKAILQLWILFDPLVRYTDIVLLNAQ